jgi:hypothetical protein
MKKTLLTLILFYAFGQNLIAQDHYKKRYYVKDSITYIQKYYDSKLGEIKTDTLKTPLQRLTSSIDTTVLNIASSKKGLLSNVAFGEKENSNKLYVNPWLVKSKGKYIDRDTIYFYSLKNRQSVKIKFKQWSFNTLSVPLKARFGSEKTEFSTGANLGALIGHSWGKTNFVHRKKLENKQYDSKWSFGLFLGADKLEFSFEDVNEEDTKVSTAFISSGLGLLYSYQNFNFGLTSGFDFGLGENSSKWDYQARPWLGITLGYSLFTF